MVLLAVVIIWFIRSGKMLWLREKLSPPTNRFLLMRLFCEDRFIRDINLQIKRYCTQNNATLRAWFYFHGALLPDFKGRNSVMAATERNAMPLGSVTEQEQKWADCNRINREATRDIRQASGVRSHQLFVMNALVIMAICGALTLTIFALTTYFMTHGWKL
jgi:hypothetical protein